MTSQSERRLTTRNKILQAARPLFNQHGFDAVTVDQIVASANIAKGTFYQHFATKTDLLVVIGRDQGAAQCAQLLEAMEQGRSALMTLSNYYHALAQWFEQHANLAEEVIISAIRAHDTNSCDPSRVPHDFTVAALELAQKQGELKPQIDHQSLATAIGGSFTLAVIQWCRQPEPPLWQRFEPCLELIMKGART